MHAPTPYTYDVNGNIRAKLSINGIIGDRIIAQVHHAGGALDSAHQQDTARFIAMACNAYVELSK